MAINLINLPEDNYFSQATVGKDYLLYINTGSLVVPEWSFIGGQRGASINESAEEIDVSHKTSGGYTDTLPGLRSWSIDLDGLAMIQDKGVEALRKAYIQGKKANIKLQYPDNSYQVGWAAITELAKETPHDGEATLSGTLNGSGPLSNISVIVSQSTAVEQNFAFDKKAKAKTVSLNGTAIDEANFITNYGELTLKSDYLASLAVGEYLFYAELTIGGYALVAVEIEA